LTILVRYHRQTPQPTCGGGGDCIDYHAATQVATAYLGPSMTLQPSLHPRGQSLVAVCCVVIPDLALARPGAPSRPLSIRRRMRGGDIGEGVSAALNPTSLLSICIDEDNGVGGSKSVKKRWRVDGWMRDAFLARLGEHDDVWAWMLHVMQDETSQGRPSAVPRTMSM
jgi:hypothetical protein